MPTVLHVAPHPDDESIAAPCTLLALQRSGWKVVNYAVSLGRADDHDRRRQELEAAIGRTRVAGCTGFENLILDPPMSISRGDNLHDSAQRLTAKLTRLIEERQPDLVVGPHPRDGHHGHVTVARAIRQALWLSHHRVVWWMWSIWSDLPIPTLIVSCADEDLVTSELMLKEYRGENQRSDYSAGTQARRIANAAFGIEKTLGWGSAPQERLPSAITHAELLTEVEVWRPPLGPRPRLWRIGHPRLLDPDNALAARWSILRDFSILTPARFRWLPRPTALSWRATHRWPPIRVGAEPMPVVDLAADRRLGARSVRHP